MKTTFNFPMPEYVTLDEKTATRNYAKFTATPFQSGFGHTMGNALRRILLSSLEGLSISAVRIDGVQHEFASIKGVVEDVTEIILNLKKVKFKLIGEALPELLEIKCKKKGVVTAADIDTNGFVEIVNPEQVICTLDKKIAFRAELEIMMGCGYRTSEKNKKDSHPVGTIPVDCLFSPVERVKYTVGAARVGEETEMDSLVLEIWTDGRIKPVAALETSSRIFKEHLRPFLGSLAGKEDPLAMISGDERKLYKVFVQNVEMMELSVRAMNCLNNAGIDLIGELCLKSEARMLKYRNFGKKSLDEIKEKLRLMKLSLGMTMTDELREAVTSEAEEFKKNKEQDGGENNATS